MAKWWEYQPWRRKALIAITWTLFGSSLAIAAVVSAVQHRKTDSQFSPPTNCGVFTVRIPAGWSANSRTSPFSRIDATEPSTLKRLNRPRQLFIVQKSLPAGTSLDEFVAQEPSLSGKSFLQQEENGDVEQITIAGYPGVLYARANAPIFMSSPIYEYIAATITPEGQAIAVKLVCVGKPSEDDQPLLESVLDRIAAGR